MNRNIENLKKYLTVTDYSVSKEVFDLYYNEEYDMLITHPQPDLSQLDTYYDNPNYISHTDNNRSLFEKMYQFVKSIALKNKLDLINSLQKEKGKLLDIGAGTADFLSVAQTDGWSTIGFEPNAKAKNKGIQKGISYISDLKEAEEHSFDVITLWHVLEHVPNLESHLQELKRLIKPSGTIIVAVPNFKSYDALYYGKFWAAFDVPIHFWHFSKKAIRLCFQHIEMEIVQILPMKFDSYYVSLLSEKYKTGNMNFIKAFCIGWLSNLKAKRSYEYSSHIYVLKKH